MGKSQRRKGHDFERWTAREFRRLYPDSRRYLDDVYGGSGIDVTAGPWAIQCKAYHKYAPIAKIEEIEDPDRFPLLVTRGDYKMPMAVLPLHLLLLILEDVGIAYKGVK